MPVLERMYLIFGFNLAILEQSDKFLLVFCFSSKSDIVSQSKEVFLKYGDKNTYENPTQDILIISKVMVNCTLFVAF